MLTNQAMRKLTGLAGVAQVVHGSAVRTAPFLTENSPQNMPLFPLQCAETDGKQRHHCTGSDPALQCPASNGTRKCEFSCVNSHPVLEAA